MKKFIVYLSTFFILSCSEHADIEQNFSSNIPKPELSTRAIVDLKNSSVTNPDFINDWENMTTVVLNSSTPNNVKTVSLPWDAASPSSLPENVSKDIKKEDGWRMLMHTFKNYGLDEHQSYFILYNDFTGVLRVYYFCEFMPEANNTFMWNVRTTNSTPSYILGSNSYPIKSLDIAPTENTIKISNYSNNEYSSLSYGWNAFEIPVTFSTSNQNIEYLISAVNANILNIKLLGTSKGTIDGKIISTTVTDNSIIKGAANLSKDASKKYVEKLLESKEINLDSKLRKGISDIVGGLVKNGVRGGLSMLFGNIFQSGTDVKNFDVNLTLQTEMEISGTSQFPSVAQVVPLNNIDLRKCNGGNNLGAWNIEKMPQVTYNKYSPVDLHSPIYGGPGPKDPKLPQPGYLRVYAPEIDFEKPNVIVNPSIQKYLKKQSVYYELVDNIGYNNASRVRCDLASFLHLDESGTYGCFYRNPESGMYIYGVKDPFNILDIHQIIEGHYMENYHLVYDWSGTKDETFVLIVTVDQTFDYNGKEIQITSSKHFKTHVKMRPDWYPVYPAGSGFGPSYIVNKDEILRL